MKKLIGYVVFEKGFEYDDEINRASESPGGDPKTVTFSKKEAKKLIFELNRESFRGCNIGHYTHDLSDLVDVVALEAIWTKNKWKWDPDHYELDIPKNATDEQVDEITSIVDLNFYDFQEVEMDLASMRNAQIERTE